MNDLFVKNIFDPSIAFTEKAIAIFNYQYNHNIVYRAWCDNMQVNVSEINQISQIPFLPISFFKTHQVVCGDFDAALIFESSGTTQTVNSKHFVKDAKLYEQSFLKGFELFYGDVKDWCILGLLPSYLERKNSSLIKMANDLIQLSNHNESGFYLYEYDKLSDVLKSLESRKQKTLLLGVTFALLDFAEITSLPLQHTIIMETGGMKGRREELTRQEVHALLRESFSVKNIKAEYGMTELLSQAYSEKEGIYRCPPWMKMMLREEDDPLKINEKGKGALNVIDLANLYSCSFIATDDAAIIHDDNSFEILGRIDNSDLRGCSLMAL